jgi:hypothetical protein
LRGGELEEAVGSTAVSGGLSMVLVIIFLP